MSWNFSVAGKDRPSVNAAIEKEEHCPPELRAFLVAWVNRAQPGADFAFHVQSDGHVDASYGNGRFSVSFVRLVS